MPKKTQKEPESKEMSNQQLSRAWHMSNELGRGHYGMSEAIDLIRELIDSNNATKDRVRNLKESIKEILRDA